MDKSCHRLEKIIADNLILDKETFKQDRLEAEMIILKFKQDIKKK